jgi:FkbM family methyltransferase
MNILRAGFFSGAWRRLSSVPYLISHVQGWPWLAADCMGMRRRPYRLQTRGGAGCELRPGTSDWWIFLEIFVFGIYRRVEADIQKSRVIIDIGANVGFFALYASSLNPEVEIHALEPFPKNTEQLKRNLLLNDRHHIQVHPLAVSDKTGTATLYFTPGDDSGCSLNQPKGQQCSVRTVSLSDFFKQGNIARCDLLKMDCEGSELAIISAIPAGEWSKIGSLIMEYHNPAEVDALKRILQDAGFECEVLPQINTLYAYRH